MVEDLLPFPDNNVKQGQKQYTGTATNRDKPKLANLRILRIFKLRVSVFDLGDKAIGGREVFTSGVLFRSANQKRLKAGKTLKLLLHFSESCKH